MEMDIQIIHCFLVHPSKHEENPPDIGGTRVTKSSGKIFTMLKGIFDNAETDCKIDITFSHNAEGKRQNDCRNLVLAYANSHKIEDGRNLAARLQAVTNNISGLGLMFTMAGSHGAHSKVVMSRFPADQGILAEEGEDSLTIEFLEKVFMKSATAYKAAMYSGKTTGAGFWNGKAIDKQINDNATQIANYWIRDFLAAELKTTAAAGTKRLAVALRTAINTLTNKEAKAEIAAAVTLATGLNGQATSAQSFCQNYGMSVAATDAVKKAMKSEDLMNENFQFDINEFRQHLAFRYVELDTGGVLMAESSRFNEVFSQEPAGEAEENIRFTTEGKIVNQSLRKSKA